MTGSVSGSDNVGGHVGLRASDGGNSNSYYVAAGQNNGLGIAHSSVLEVKIPVVVALEAPVLSLAPGIKSPFHVTPGFFLTIPNQGSGLALFFRSADCKHSLIFRKNFSVSEKGTKIPLTIVMMPARLTLTFSARLWRSDVGGYTSCSNNIKYTKTRGVRLLPDEIVLNGGLDMRISHYFTDDYLSKNDDGYNIFEQTMQLWNGITPHYSFFKVPGSLDKTVSNHGVTGDGISGIYGHDVWPFPQRAFAITKFKFAYINVGTLEEYVEIREADIHFNLGQGDQGFQEKLLHELGHAIGLPHPTKTLSVMSPVAGKYYSKTFTEYDVKTVNELYKSSK